MACLQTSADPARTKVPPAPGLCRAVAGQEAGFTIKVFPETRRGKSRSSAFVY